MMQKLTSDIDPAPMLPNIAQLLERNVKQFGDFVAYAELQDGVYKGITWKTMYENILNIAWNLQHRFGFRKGDKMVIYSPNRREMLELSLAVMPPAVCRCPFSPTSTLKPPCCSSTTAMRGF